MLAIYKTIEENLREFTSFDGLLEQEDTISGAWVNLVAPTEEEILQTSERLHIDLDFVRAALDDEERARIEVEDANILIIVDMPQVEMENDSFVYTTLPLGIVLTEEALVTVMLKESPLVNDFIDGRVKTFYTYKRTRFILQLLYRNAARFLSYLKQIDKASTRVEGELHKSMKNKELIQMLKLEKSLVFFSTSLKGNELVLEKLLRMDYSKKYPDDTDLLEDVIVENKQAIEMCTIYRDILSGTMDAFASVISNNLNIVMKFMAAVTIILAVPALVAALWGMNVPVPFESNPMGFWIVIGIAALATLLATIYMARRKMF